MFGDLTRFQSLASKAKKMSIKIAIGDATYDGFGSGSDFGGVRPRDMRSRSSIPVCFASFFSLLWGGEGDMRLARCC